MKNEGKLDTRSMYETQMTLRGEMEVVRGRMGRQLSRISLSRTAVNVTRHTVPQLLPHFS